MMRNSTPLYITAGMSRSGSTWLFNAVRLILKGRYSKLYSCWIEEFDETRARGCDAILIKTHKAAPEFVSEADAIFISHRDLRDIAVSLRDMGWLSERQDWASSVDTTVSEHDYWARLCDIDISYEEILGSPLRTLYRLSRIALPNQSMLRRCFCIWNIYRGIDTLPEAPTKNIVHHNETLLHHGHRQSGGNSRWRTELPEDVANQIARRHEVWLAKMNYLPAASYPNNRQS